MKILIIDDDRKFYRALKDFFEILDYQVDTCLLPSDGIKKVERDKSYDVIFIDFKFPGSAKVTGADLGLKIREISPISALILTTAFGEHHIHDFIYVGFDNYISKYSEGEAFNFPKMQEELINCVKIARLNSKKRLKTEFTEEELTEVLQRMTYLKRAVQEMKYITQKSLAEKVEQYMNTHKKEGVIPNTVKIPKTYNAHSGFFQLKQDSVKVNGKKVKITSTNYFPNALKARQILKNNYHEWKDLVNSFEPLKKIKNEFDIS